MTIKANPVDFRVDELLAPHWQQSIVPTPAPCGVYLLTKRAITSNLAADQVARKLNLPSEAVSFGGLKDKYAITTQHITVGPMNKPDELPQTLEDRHWSITRLGYTDQPIDSSAVAGNRFTIVARALDEGDCTWIDRVVHLLRLSGDTKGPALLQMPNYFGSQRFGSARHGRGWVAKALLAGDFESALKLAIAEVSHREGKSQREFKHAVFHGWGDWKNLARKLPPFPEKAPIVALAKGASFKGAFCSLPYFNQAMYVEAYQSFLWNATVTRLIETELAGKKVLEVESPFGTMLFPPSASVPSQMTDLEVPLFAPKTALDGPWADAAKWVLDKEKLRLEDLRIPGLHRPFFGESMRKMMVQVSNFTATAPAPDDNPETAASAASGRRKADKARAALMRTLSFDLPRGAYATVLLASMGQGG